MDNRIAVLEAELRVKEHKIAKLTEELESMRVKADVHERESQIREDNKILRKENDKLVDLVKKLNRLLQLADSMHAHLLQLKHVDVMENEFYEFLGRKTS
jgi:flagellar basal body P-ring protein FlgI